MTTAKFQILTLSAMALMAAQHLPAQEIASGELDALVVQSKKASAGDVSEKLEITREKTAGAVTTVSPEELKLQGVGNLGDVFNQLPGVNYIDEDGRGTKPNIGLRGLNPIRSEFLQLLNNGVSTQPSLYSEHAGYYGVPAERVAGIEVIKGGASIFIWSKHGRRRRQSPLARAIGSTFCRYSRQPHQHLWRPIWQPFSQRNARPIFVRP